MRHTIEFRLYKFSDQFVLASDQFENMYLENDSFEAIEQRLINHLFQGFKVHNVVDIDRRDNNTKLVIKMNIINH